MKAKGITKKLLGITISAISMVVALGPVAAFARQADPDPKTPAAPVAPLQNASSGRAWIIPLLIGAAVILVTALVGRVRIRRSRGVAWG